ncbi:hypothetical protein [Desulfurococcus amylolyticus]|uniref:Uncharacterized protein n=1 Tax=Desulfurococcus amylolyticus DSM 16532 TaxID=768672 RepID=I3XQ06_DESAM|nr:hypothetical protein [Desulfurococcus amylolyticus]AFL66030.1 hypothetical protein Desfe_0117 [Desulfurococcus amylolyticus DSM 16532]
MPKEKKDTGQQSTGAEKGKEIKIVTKHVVTPSDLEKNPRAVKLLYIISLSNGISEKALMSLLYLMTQNGYDLGYSFTLLTQSPTSRDVLNELTMLKYLGFVEVGANKKLIISSAGKEFLEAHLNIVGGDAETIKKLFSDLKPKIQPLDVEVDVKTKRRL